MVERRLGRGLDFFLSDSSSDASRPEDGVLQLEVNSLVPSPFQPRREFAVAELESLARSIRVSGVLQPVLVRKRGEQYELVAGERRWRAAKQAGLERIPALVKEIADEMAAVFGLVENLQRADLNAIEKAKGFKRIQQLTKGRQEDIARQVGLERSTVANFLRLLELPDDVQAHVSRGTLSMGHARALLTLASAEEQTAVAEEIVRKQLSVRDVETLVKQLDAASQAPGDRGQGSGNAGGSTKTKQRPVWLNELEENLVEALGTPVTVKYGNKRSKITIECLGREEFERVYELLKSLGPD